MVARLLTADGLPMAVLPLAQSTQPTAALTVPASPVLAAPVGPLLVLALCLVAGIGTVMLLPGKREASFRRLGGVVLAVAGLLFAGLLARSAAGVGAYFWIFSGIALVASVRVITHPRPVYSALYFVLTVLASAGLFVLLSAQFMAAALVLIYAGAILITYVFVIMLAASSTSDRAAALATVADYDAVSREPVFASLTGFGLMGMFLFLIFDRATAIAPRGEVVPATPYPAVGDTQSLGAYLYSDQVVNLELAGLILTLAMVGAIVIARRQVWAGGTMVTPPAGTPGGGAVLTAAATPIDDNPHSIPVYGTDNPRQKAYPET